MLTIQERWRLESITTQLGTNTKSQTPPAEPVQSWVTARTVWGTYRGRARGRLIGNQPKRQVAQAMLALGDQLCVPAHTSFLQEARQPGTCRPNPDLSASRFTSPRNQLNDRCFQLPTASRQSDGVLGGTSEMQPHPPGTLFILKPP